MVLFTVDVILDIISIILNFIQDVSVCLINSIYHSFISNVLFVNLNNLRLEITRIITTVSPSRDNVIGD